MSSRSRSPTRCCTVLAGEVARFTLLAVDERRREGRLEFHDLLVLARSLLRDSADARGALHERYSRLLIDEFQDTDPIQIELAMLIAASVGGGTGAGRLVGHRRRPRAALLRGRPEAVDLPVPSGDIGLFLDARDRFATEAVRLTTNFRTVPPLVAWVNEVFGGLMAEERPRSAAEVRAADRPPGRGPGRAPGAAARSAAHQGREAAGRSRCASSRPRRWPTPSPGSSPSPRRGRSRTPAAGGRPDPRTSPSCCRRARRSASSWTRCGRAGVEFRAETGTLVYETQEIRDLIAILRSVAHGADAVALVAALRSPDPRLWGRRPRDLRRRGWALGPRRGAPRPAIRRTR